MFFGEHKKPIGTCVQTDDFAPRGDLSVAEHRTLWWRFFNSVPAVDLVLLPSQFLPHFLEVFAKLARAIISIVMSVRPSVCVCVCQSAWNKQIRSHSTDFHEIWYLNIFWKSVKKIHVSLYYKIWRSLNMRTYEHLWQYIADFFWEWENISDKDYREHPNTYFILGNFLQKIMSFMK